VAHPHHHQVRSRYQGRCGYCGVTEDEVGGELTVDHYVPLTAGGDDSEANLVYACFRCNLFKSDFYPTALDRQLGRYVLHPLRDDPKQHWRLDEATGRLEPISESGRFHITLLHLNRSALVAHRLSERHQLLLAAKTELLMAEIDELRAIMAAQDKYIESLKKLVQ
jgi:HNH endonuclease